MVVLRFEIYLVKLEPTVGHEIRKVRPCAVISPNEMNRLLGTVLIAPMTTAGKPYPCRVPCHFQSKSGLIALDQIRSVDKQRLIKRMGRLKASEAEAVLRLMQEMFAP